MRTIIKNEDLVPDLSPAEQALLMQSLVNNFTPEAVTILMTNSTEELKTKGVPQFNDAALSSMKINKSSACNDVIDNYKAASNNLIMLFADCSLDTKHLCATFCALYEAITHENGLMWFGWRNGNEVVNTANFCRLLYHLVRNRFFANAHWDGKKISGDSLSFILTGAIEFGSNTVDNKRVIIPLNVYTHRTLRTYITAANGDQDFEQFCGNLTINKYFNKSTKQF